MARDLLRDYKRKRDFSLSDEPQGKKITKKKKAKKLIFVVQEHHARRLHYDFRLELEGVLKSWAVPKGPSLDPSEKRLAVQTEDHPMEYAKFHGKIPAGEYGAGEVFIWDKGTWESLDDDPIAAFHQGHLHFKLKGKRLNGTFVLVRTHLGGENQKNWLLIKHYDPVESPLAKKTKKASKKVAKKKSPPLGKDPWPGFIHPELPRLVREVPEETGEWVHEMKFDGYRMQGHVQNGVGQFISRNGLEWSNYFPHLLKSMEDLPLKNAIIDGEIVALDEEGKTHFQKLQNSIKSKNDSSLRYYVFDLLYLDGKDLRKLPLLERKERLKDLLSDESSKIIFSEHVSDNGKNFYEAACEHKLEGVVSKLKDSPYVSGRSDLWVKTKCSMRQEFVVGGWTDPKGGRTGLGALLLGVFEKKKLHFVGRVGTGFNTKTLKSILEELKKIEAKKSPFHLKSPSEKGVHWVKPIKICEVSFGNWTEEGILRTPVFLGMREDKAASEIHVEKARETIISSPDKILFKKEKITKKQVLDYYQQASKVMLPYIAGRPLSLVRCPNGSEGTCFFQKHISGKVPSSFHPVAIQEGGGEEIYLAIDSKQGLEELVQLNAFEIHAWNSHMDNYLRPNQFVMDLDPGPDVPWSEVVDAAFEMKKLLEDLDLKSFVKLTGGKGLHLHVPIAPLYDWNQVKSFTMSLALELVSRNPKKYTANMSKRVRKGRIFIDYLRNGYGATAVVPYSLRAKPQSAVALPVEWSELRKIKHPQEFTLVKALQKIKARRKDPWEGMLKLKQKIEILKPTNT